MNDLQVDEGHRILSDLIRSYGRLQLEDANEAQTRFEVIDGILEKVLGWQKSDISVEPACTEFGHSDYADYLVRTATTSMVVEAKRAGASFSLPSNVKSSKLGGFLSKGDIGEAIQQARQYCVIKSAQFAVVTNGAVWIAFPAIRTDGVEFSDTQARIFRSLEDIDKRFVEFWELLSRQRVIEGNLERELLQRDREATVQRALSLIKEPDLRVDRNTLFPHLSLAVDKVLTDKGLFDDSQALSFCYVLNTDRTEFDSRLRMYLADPKPHLAIAATRVKTSPKNYDFFDKKIVQSETAQPKFFLILGQVGAGKSTFLAYTRMVSAKDAIDDKIGWFSLDFKKATEFDAPREFIYAQLRDLIEADTEFDLGDWSKTIQPAYEQEIQNLARGPLYLLNKTDPVAFEKEVAGLVMREREAVVPYVERLLKYLACTRPVFIAIDNVDQIEDDERQNQIFAESQALGQKLGVNVIVALRDTTFRKYRASPTFDAFEIEAIYIDPPSVVPVLSRRLTFARRMLKDVKVDLTLQSGAHVRVEDIGAFFEIVSQSLLSGEGAELLNTLAGGNIRRGLTLAREFLASGHVTADVALQKYLTDRTWRFPLHEVFKGAVLGGRKFYREEDSLLPNMFSAKLGLENLQILRFTLANCLVHMAQSSNFEGVLTEELEAALHQVGVAQREVDDVLRTLLNSSIVRTTDGAPLTRDSRIVPTRLAGYLVFDLSARFNYVEMCVIDAHVYSPDLWDQVRKLTQQIQFEGHPISRIRLRIDRARAFISHLEAVEEKWIIEANRRNLGLEWADPVIKSRVRPALEQDMERALLSAQANFRNQKRIV